MPLSASIETSLPKRATAARYVLPLGPSFGPFARMCWVPSISQQYPLRLAQYRTEGFFAMIVSSEDVQGFGIPCVNTLRGHFIKP